MLAVSIFLRGHDLIPTHVAGLDEAKGVVDTQGRKHANVTKVFRPLHVRRRTYNGSAVPMTTIGFDWKMFNYDDR